MGNSSRDSQFIQGRKLCIKISECSGVRLTKKEGVTLFIYMKMYQHSWLFSFSKNLS